jgi:hypothetical protein
VALRPRLGARDGAGEAGGSLRRYHHLGIPTDVPRSGETYLEEFRVHVAGFDTSPYGVEWMRFEPGCPVPELVRTVPHVAFEVDDLEAEMAGREVLIAPNSPSSGVTVAFIVHDGAPIELIRFEKGFEVRAGSRGGDGRTAGRTLPKRDSRVR